MKQFGIIFGAVLCAIIAAVLVLYGWMTVSSWESKKSSRLIWVAKARESIAKDQNDLGNYQPRGDTYDDLHSKRLISNALESEQKSLARAQSELVGIYDDKPWMLTSEEREQQQEFVQAVGEYKAQHPNVDLKSPF